MTRASESSTGIDLPKPASAAATCADPDAQQIVQEEEGCLRRVLEQLRRRTSIPPASSDYDYDRAMLELRDEMASARLEDVPPLVEQMDRLQRLAARRRETRASAQVVDVQSPYFGRLVLQEGERRREVLIGRSTYLDTDSGVRIVDWRDAPVSRVYYRYDEGDDYCETFGDREVEGEVLVRRTLTIEQQTLRRIATPEDTFARTRDGHWRRLDRDTTRLRGGQGTATRADPPPRAGRLGVSPDGEYREDKHLREITALIDRHQFELITRPDSGLVVIQGGAGSGKTTIGLHRLAYLAYHDPRRFRSDRNLVVVFNEALARFISMVLPSLGIQEVAIRTYEDWASRLRSSHFPSLRCHYCEETPAEVTRLKKHPALLPAIDAAVERLSAQLERRVRRAFVQEASGAAAAAGEALVRVWQNSLGRPLTHRLHAMRRELSEGRGRALPPNIRLVLEREVRAGLDHAQDVLGVWSDLLSDRTALGEAFAMHAPGAFSDTELDRVHQWCTAHCADVTVDADEERERAAARQDHHQGARHDHGHDGEYDHSHGIDGRSLDEQPTLDREDDTLLLRLYQKLRGPLMRGRKGKEALVYEHMFIDETQDLSPVELAVLMETLSGGRCVTLAGDVAQRLYLDNGFTDWKSVLAQLRLAHVEIEPLRLSYRSTQEIMDFSQHVLGPLASPEPTVATRHGAAVELFTFAHSGEAAGFLAESLRDLMHTEPRASVAVIARYPEQADIYFEGLQKSEVPHVRRIVEQDFPFRPGVDVTDVRQVKGLEFDYVVVVEVNDTSFPADDQSRHLLHIAATRAAHQLWLLSTSRPSPLLPAELLDEDR